MIRGVACSCNPSHVLRTRKHRQDKQLERPHSHWCTSLSPQLWRPFCQAGRSRTKVALKVMLWAFRSLHTDVQLKLPISLPIGWNRFDWFVINSTYWRTEQDGWRRPFVPLTPNTSAQTPGPRTSIQSPPAQLQRWAQCCALVTKGWKHASCDNSVIKGTL